MKSYQVPNEERYQHTRTTACGEAKTEDRKLARWEELERQIGVEKYGELLELQVGNTRTKMTKMTKSGIY